MLINNSYSAGNIEREIETALNNFIDTKQHRTDRADTHLLYYSRWHQPTKWTNGWCKTLSKTHHSHGSEPHKAANLLQQQANIEHDHAKQPTQGSWPLVHQCIVYECTCPQEDCKPPYPKSSYIGHTTNTLTKRLTFHKQSGEIQKHMKQRHRRDLTRSDLAGQYDHVGPWVQQEMPQSAGSGAYSEKASCYKHPTRLCRQHHSAWHLHVKRRRHIAASRREKTKPWTLFLPLRRNIFGKVMCMAKRDLPGPAEESAQLKYMINSMTSLYICITQLSL